MFLTHGSLIDLLCFNLNMLFESLVFRLSSDTPFEMLFFHLITTLPLSLKHDPINASYPTYSNSPFVYLPVSLSSSDKVKVNYYLLLLLLSSSLNIYICMIISRGTFNTTITFKTINYVKKCISFPSLNKPHATLQGHYHHHIITIIILDSFLD